jgi:hypothetical protein
MIAVGGENLLEGCYAAGAYGDAHVGRRACALVAELLGDDSLLLEHEQASADGDVEGCDMLADNAVGALNRQTTGGYWAFYEGDLVLFEGEPDVY